MVHVVDGSALELACFPKHILNEGLSDGCGTLSELVLESLVRLVKLLKVHLLSLQIKRKSTYRVEFLEPLLDLKLAGCALLEELSEEPSLADDVRLDSDVLDEFLSRLLVGLLKLRLQVLDQVT